MRALVTGATGCVGANIVEALLARGYAVRALRRRSSRLDALDDLTPEFVLGDVSDLSSLEKAMEGCDWVFHAAAISQYWRNDTETIFRVNVEGTKNVLKAAQTCGVKRVIFTSSAGALGVPTRAGELIDETHPFNLPPERFPYGYSKLLAEQEVQAAVADGLDAVIVNPVSVIGQRDVYFVGGEIIRQARRGRLLAVPPGGTNFVSARAAGLGHVLAAERGLSGERYILAGDNVTFLELANLIAEIIGSKPPRYIIPARAIEPMARLLDDLTRLGIHADLEGNQLRLSALQLYFDGRKAERELGFPHVPLREAIVEAWTWYRERGLL